MLPAESRSWFASRPRNGLLALSAVMGGALVGALTIRQPKLGVGLVLAIALAVAVLLRPIIGGYVLAGVVPVTSGLQQGFPLPYVRLSEVLIGAVFCVLAFSVRRADAVPWTAMDWLLLAYGLAWAVFGAADPLLRGESLALSNWGTILGQLQWLLIYRGVRLAARTPRDREMLFLALCVASVPAALLAVGQEIHVPGLTRFLTKVTGSTVIGSAGEKGFFRVTGPFDQWSVLAGYLFAVLVPTIALFVGGAAAKWRRFLAVVVALDLGALVLTAELSAILGLVAGVVGLGAWAKRSKIVLKWLGGGAVIGGAVLGPHLATRLASEFSGSAITGRSALFGQTLAFRVTIWTTQYLPAFMREPLFGYGVLLPASISWPYSESQYISLLVEGGVTLLALFAVLSWFMISTSMRAAKGRDPFTASLGRGLAVACILLVPMDAIWPYLTNGGLPQVLFCLLGLLPIVGSAKFRNETVVVQPSGSRVDQAALTP